MNMLKESSGKYSLTRVLSAIVVLYALVMGTVAIVVSHGAISSSLSTLVLGLVAIGLTGKVTQKILEK